MQFEKYTDSHVQTPRLFVFEGSDRESRNLLAAKVADNLCTRGVNVLFVSLPDHESRTPLESICDKDRNGELCGPDYVAPISLQIASIAARVDCIEKLVRPALSNHQIVILDRYWWSTAAYGTATRVPTHVLAAMIALERSIWGNIKPDRLFLITHHRISWARLSQDQEITFRDSFEKLRQRHKYLYPIDVLQNTDSLDDIADIIAGYVHKTNIFHSNNTQLLQEFSRNSIMQNKSNVIPTIIHWHPTKTTEVFDTYWRFAAERQDIFFRRFYGKRQPWTRDQIFLDYKFTNAYRASDRVSQFLIRHVIYEAEQDPTEVIFRILLFKTFNKIETWKLLTNVLGEITWREFDYQTYDNILTKAQKNRTSIYSAAYIMPSGAKSFGHSVKHRNHLSLIHRMMTNDLPSRITDAKSMHQVFELLRGYPMIGDFLAYQYATDINYSAATDFSEMSFVIPGPGAKSGIRKCFSDFGGLSEVDIIKLMADRQKSEFQRLGLQFQDLWHRPLQLIDCQNLFCEVDKYARVAHPNIKDTSGRTRIKQKFRPTSEPIEYFYPPKWNINDTIKKHFSE